MPITFASPAGRSARLRSLVRSSHRAFSTTPSRSAPKPKALCGSAPNYTRHLILHGQSSENWPSHLEAVSPLARALGGWGAKPGLSGVGVTFGERGDECALEEGEVEWDRTRSKFDPVRGEAAGEE